MIEIKKHKEPKKLLTYRLQDYSSYKDLPSDIKEVVLDSLMEEQGHLCAYCMRRIPLKNGNPTATIEHLKPQNAVNEDEKLNYKNMLAVCPGNRNATDNNDKSCDAFRGSLPVKEQGMTVNPLNASTLREIKYKGNGIIYSDNEMIDSDLNEKLNLNCKAMLLPECRANALKALQEVVMKNNLGRSASKEYFNKLLEKYTRSDSYKTPYVGILIKWLESKI
ncbi:MAG TPA: hypothetical protein PLH98_17140 [Ruminococcus flavefaciens]|nr:hypothetical protein [Ruminococcus flavefaciens]